MKKCKWQLVCCCALCWSTLSAQTDTIPLKNVLVSANRTDQSILDVGRSVTLITKDEIIGGNYTNLAELLSEQEGIFIVGTNQNPGQVQSVFMRGTNSDQVLIMIDGVRITDPSGVNNAIDLTEISLTGIKQIEIIRGSHSVMYGSSAIGGVINIITENVGNPGLNANVALSEGTFYLHTFEMNQNLHLNYTLKSGIYAGVDVFNTNVNGMDATIDTVTNPSIYNHPDNDNFDKQELKGKLGYHNDKIDLWGSYNKSNHLSDVDNGAYNDDDNYTVEFSRNTIQYGVTYKINNSLKAMIVGGNSSMQRIAINDSSIIDDLGNYDQNYFKGTYDGTINTNELQLNYNRDFIQVLGGGGLYNETMNNKTYTYSGAWLYESEFNMDTLNPEQKMYYGFLNFGINGGIIDTSWSCLALNAGLRINNSNLFGSNLTYQMDFSYKLTKNAILFLSYSTGFNAPSLYRLYEPTANFTSTITRGNPDLKPETSQSFEIGMKKSFKPISFSVSLFQTVVTNEIEYVYLWDGAKEIDSLTFMDNLGDTYINLGKQTMRGFEASLIFYINYKLAVRGNVSVVDGKIEVSKSDVDNAHTQGNLVQLFQSGNFVNGNQEIMGLVRRSNTANIQLRYEPVTDLTIVGGMYCVSPREDVFYDAALGPYGALNTQTVDSYALYNVGLNYVVTKNLSANLKVNDLLDKKHTEIYGYSTKGRSVYLTLRFDL